jgi:hypothetical protein
MKIKRDFSPVTITFETEKELTIFKEIIWQVLKRREDRNGFRGELSKTDWELAAQYLHERLADK